MKGRGYAKSTAASVRDRGERQFVRDGAEADWVSYNLCYSYRGRRIESFHGCSNALF